MQPAAPTPPAGEADAMQLLRQDHEQVAQLFAEFESLQQGDDRQRVAQVVQEVSAALTLHAQLEEEIFYPAVEQATGDRGLVDHARQEHAQVKQAVLELTAMQPDDQRLASTMAKLSQDVAQHVREEETKMFTQARDRIDAAALGRQMAERRREIVSPPAKPEDYVVEDT